MHTVLVTHNEPCQDLSGLGIIGAVTFSTHCKEQKKVFLEKIGKIAERARVLVREYGGRRRPAQPIEG